MSYIVRTKSGEMKAKISHAIASSIVNSSSGFFREAKFPNGTKIVFEFTADMSWDISDDLRFYFWEGDKLVPE